MNVSLWLKLKNILKEMHIEFIHESDNYRAY
jgi:hypothetical protein